MTQADGVPLKSIAETPGFDPTRTWGPGPLLLIQAPHPDGDAPFLFSTPDGGRDEQGHVNAASTAQLFQQGPLSAYLAPNAVLVPIRKTTRNSFGGQITIGRARNNDIRLSDPSVSKVHAYVIPPKGWPMLDEGGWYLRDAGSTNGTYMLSGSGAVKADMRSGLLLAPGTEIRLGSVLAIYVDPEHLRGAIDYAKQEWSKRDREAAKKGSDDTARLQREGTARLRRPD